MQMVDEALKYQEAGFSIIPIGSNKKPKVLWKEFQTRIPSLNEVKAWWAKFPTAQIGMVTGKINNLTVVDCDSKEILESVLKLLPEGFPVLSSKTQRGVGTHLCFGFTPGLKSRNRVEKYLDVKSEGGFVIVPPSRGMKGSYAWTAGSDIRTNNVRPPIPPALLQYLKDRMKRSDNLVVSGTPSPLGASPGGIQDPITEGTRDDRLFHMALKLFKSREPYDSVKQYVLTAARGCSPPFPEREALAKVDSAYKRLQERPMRTGCSQQGGEEVDQLASRDASSVQDRAIPWLWRGVFPTHMATALTGDQGLGKTLVAVDLSARISHGSEFPIYDRPSPMVLGKVLYVTSEGVPEMILVPRLRVAGADLSKIKIIEGTYLKNGEFSILDMTRDLPRLEQEARDFGDVKLLVVDPIASVLPESINPNQQNQVRRAMDRMSNLAYSLGIAVVIVMHWAKDRTLSGANKTAGSVQFGAAMKMSWGVVQSEDDPRNVRLLVPQKSNISGNHKSLRFSIHGVEYSSIRTRETIETSKIEYEGLVDDDPEMLMNPLQENENHVVRACGFIRKKFRDQDRLPAGTLLEEAEREGIPRWALYKAKKRLGIEDVKEGKFQGRAFWFRRPNE
jgi:putative DNA primase/helicase